MNIDTVKRTAKKLNINTIKYPIKTLLSGYKIELEHGTKAGKYNTTNNSPTKTLKTVMAHLTEHTDYYKILKKVKI
jgi:hypothetical protein